jgi:hypothetical protein
VLTASFLLGLALSASPVSCDGPGAKDETVLKTERAVESGAFFQLAASRWGAPVSCSADVRKQGAEILGNWTWRFKSGGAFSYDLSPPEVVVATYSLERGIEERMVEALFALDGVKQANIHAQGKSELDADADAGTTTETHWSSDEGFNAGIDLVRKAGKVVALRFHLAV